MVEAEFFDEQLVVAQLAITDSIHVRLVHGIGEGAIEQFAEEARAVRGETLQGNNSRRAEHGAKATELVDTTLAFQEMESVFVQPRGQRVLQVEALYQVRTGALCGIDPFILGKRLLEEQVQVHIEDGHGGGVVRYGSLVEEFAQHLGAITLEGCGTFRARRAIEYAQCVEGLFGARRKIQGRPLRGATGELALEGGP